MKPNIKKKQFTAPEVSVMKVELESSLLMGSFGGEGGASTKSLTSATFDWSEGKI